VIRRDCSRDHRLAQPAAGVNDCLVASAGHRVGGEHDAGSLGGHHRLHDDRNPYLARLDAAPSPVRNRSLGPQRSPALSNRVNELLLPENIQEAVLLPGEGRAWQVLGGGAGSHRHCTAT
jgi:hypothetical protein